MAIYDYTQSFYSIRRQISPLTTEKLEGKASFASPVWYKNALFVDNLLSKIKTLLGELESLHENSLKSVLINHKETISIDREINRVTKEIYSLIQETSSSIPSLSSQAPAGASSDVSRRPIDEIRPSVSAENRMVRLNLMREKTSSLKSLSENFRALEKSYLQRLEAQKNTAASSANSIKALFDVTEDDSSLNSKCSEGKGDDRAQASLSAEDTIRVEQIEKTLAQVEGLSSMFEDMKTFVLEQGSVLDRIDHQLGETVEFADAGFREVVKIESMVRNDKAKTIMKWLTAIFVVLFILNILKLVFRSK